MAKILLVPNIKSNSDTNSNSSDYINANVELLNGLKTPVTSYFNLYIIFAIRIDSQSISKTFVMIQQKMNHIIQSDALLFMLRHRTKSFLSDLPLPLPYEEQTGSSFSWFLSAKKHFDIIISQNSTKHNIFPHHWQLYSNISVLFLIWRSLIIRRSFIMRIFNTHE